MAGSPPRDASPAARGPRKHLRLTAELASDGLHCTGIRVAVDTSGFAIPPGQPAAITVNVWCTVDLSDIGVRGLPGSKTLHDAATSPLDPARDVP